MSMIGYLTPISAGQFDALNREPDGVSDLVRHENSHDLDKAWHGLHFLLTGKAWGGAPPLGHAIVGGAATGPDQGYGPAMLVTPAQVAEVALALAAVTEETLRGRYDPKAMDEQHIYPTVWAREGTEGLAWLLHYLSPLKQFYAEAARRGDAVLQWIA